VRAAVAEAQGRIVDTQGDSFFAVFRTAQDAVAAAVAAQRELEAHGWPDGEALRVRMGLHSAEPKTSGERYVGMGVHRAARIGSAAHGGQVLLSDATRALLTDDKPKDITLRDLGSYRLKDMNEPVRLYQLVVDGLRQEFPRPKSLDSRRRRLLRRRSVVIGVAVALVLVVAGVVAGLLASSGGSAKSGKLVADSIAVVDSRSGRPVGDVPLGFTPADVTASGDRIWALNQSGGTVVAIDPRTLEVVQTVGLDGIPSSQYAVGNSDFVAIPGGVDQINNSGATKIALWAPTHLGHGGAPSSGYGSCLPFVTGDGHIVWVSEGRHFAELDAATGDVLRTQILQAAPKSLPGTTCYGVRYTGGQLFSLRDPDESVGTLDPRTGAYEPLESPISGLTATSTGGGRIGWAAGFGSLWLTGSNVNSKTFQPQGVVTRYDLSNGQLTGRTPIGGSLGRLAVDPASGIWVLDKTGLALVHVNPGTGQVMQRLSLRHFPCARPQGSSPA
jgi:hypothetical protein